MRNYNFVATDSNSLTSHKEWYLKLFVYVGKTIKNSHVRNCYYLVIALLAG